MALVEATDHVAFFDDGVLKKQLVSAFADRAASTTIKLLVRNGNSFVKKPWSDIRITAQDSTEQFLAFRSGAPILAKSAKLSEFTVHPDLRPAYADLKQISISETNGAIVFDDDSIKIFSSYQTNTAKSRAGMGQVQNWPDQTWESFERTLPYTYGDGLQAQMPVFPRLSPSPALPTGGVFYSTDNLEGFFYLHNGSLYSWGEEVTRYWDNNYSIKYVPGSPIETGVSWLHVFRSQAVSYIKNGVAYMRGSDVDHTGFGGNTYQVANRVTYSNGTPFPYAINNPTALFFNPYDTDDHVFAIANGQAYAAGYWKNRNNYNASVDTTVWGTNHQSTFNNAGSANRTTIASGILGYVNNFQPIGGLSGQITKISTSGDHFLALNNAGTVYAWGRNNDWECGRDSAYFEALGERDGNYIETPRTIKTGPPAVSPPDLPLCRDILALEDVSLAVDNSGNVWGWGSNRNVPGSVMQLLGGLDNFDDYDNVYPTILPYFPANVKTIELHEKYTQTIIVKTTDKKIFVLTPSTGTIAGFYYTGRHHFTESYLHPNTTRWKIFRV